MPLDRLAGANYNKSRLAAANQSFRRRDPDRAGLREMKRENMTLKEIKEGQSARVLSVGGSGALRQHLLDMGIIPGTDIRIVKYAPMGDPVEICLHGYELTLRLDDADKIEVEQVSGDSVRQEEALPKP